MSGLLIKIAVIGMSGIGAQWAARKLRIPVKDDGKLVFRQGKSVPDPGPGDTILAFGPAQPQEKATKAAAAVRKTQT